MLMHSSVVKGLDYNSGFSLISQVLDFQCWSRSGQVKEKLAGRLKGYFMSVHEVQVKQVRSSIFLSVKLSAP